MRVEWHGQSAFHFSDGDQNVFIDPFGDMSVARERGLTWDYPPIEVDGIDLLLVTHEHSDHNAVEVVGGDPVILRAAAGRYESPVGEVLGVASEHDDAAGTERGPNTIFCFELGGVRVCHFGDFGQARLRPEQSAALGQDIDMLILPVGAGPTIGAQAAVRIVTELDPRWVVPMHYRTERVGFLEPIDAFAEAIGDAHQFPGPVFETSELPANEGPLLVVPAAP
jgi:L-ascorbate metabolism protein UlaG (beta-lactamase superfamily)